MIIILITLCIILTGGAFCTVFKAGENENICKYRED